jgi:flagellin
MVFPIGGGGFSTQNLFGMNKAKGILSDTINRISSGNRIPIASFDPVGLTVSEKFRGQIRGLNRASTNTQDGISLLRTAEGGLSGLSDGLVRLRELTIQAGNGAYTEGDIAALEEEAKQILAGFDDTSSRTQFNTKNLLDGSTSGDVSTDAGDVQAFITGDISQSGDFQGTLRGSLDEDGNQVIELSMSGAGSGTVTLDSNNRAVGALGGVDLQFGDISNAEVKGSKVNFEDTFTFANATQTTITDQTGNTATVNIAAGNITSQDMVDQFNTDFTANGVDAQAKLDDDGNVVFEGTVSGESLNVSGTGAEFSQATGIFDQNIAGSSGEVATAQGLNNESYVSDGLEFNSQVSFTVQDGQAGAATQVDLGGAGVTLTRDEILETVNSQLQAGGQRVQASFSDEGEMVFQSEDVGDESRVTITDVSAGVDTLQSTLGVSDSSDSGEGSTRFSGKVFRGGLNFQTGSNQGQSQGFSFGDFSSGALNLQNIDLQSQEGRDAFLGRVDQATSRVSSARSSIGSQENRFRSTFNNLTSSIGNFSASEALIRGADLAKESVTLATQQALLQTSMFAQTQMLDINKSFMASVLK